MQKFTAPTSNVEERRGVEIKSVRNHQYIRSKIKVGRRTYLNKYEETLVVASAEMEGAHELPIDVNKLGSEIQFFIKAVNARQSTKDITSNSSSKYTHSVIKRVNRI